MGLKKGQKKHTPIKHNNKAKLLAYLSNPENDWPKRQEYSAHILGYKNDNQIYRTMTPDELTAVESEAMEIDVEALIAEKSASQHELGFILGQEKTREEWEETLDRMIGYGAKINEEEKQLIIDYLVSR